MSKIIERLRETRLFNPVWRPLAEPDVPPGVLFRVFYQDLGCRTALDVGCGEGEAVEHLRMLGYDAWGVDSPARAARCRERIAVHDLTGGPYLARRRFDFVWCCATVENIAPRYAGNVAVTLAANCGRFLALTHAEPGGRGLHCRARDYWIELIEAAGLRFDEFLTVAMRGHAVGENPQSPFAHTGLVFARLD